MKKIALLLSMLSFFFTAYTQHDSTQPGSPVKIYHNIENRHFKDILAKSPSLEVLIIDGDSLYNMLDAYKFSHKIKSKNTNFRIVENPDTIQKIIASKIKSLIIITKDE